MKWEPKKVYLYLVSLVTFIMVLVGSYQLVSTVVDLALPTEDYWSCAKEPTPTATSEQDQQRCEEDRRRNEANQQIYKKRSLIQNSIFLVITVPAYLYHWRAARKTEE